VSDPADLDGEDLVALARERERDQPSAERRARGQFSTPAPIARSLVRWALPDDAGYPEEPPRVLDPAAGGGVFAMAAVERLRDRAGPLPDGVVTAVEPDADALALAERALDGAVRTVEADFFECDPADLGRVDAVVGNPPYRRQEALDKAHLREHLAAFGPDGTTPYLDGDRAIDGRSDAYVYFLTHATRFLRPGGRLAMILPTKWLATRYGERLQRFLLDQYRIHAVVGFGARAFPDALVDAAVVCLERAPDPARRREGVVRFVRVEAPMSGAEFASVLARPVPDGSNERRERRSGDGRPTPDDDGRTVQRGDGHRTVAVRGAALADRGPGKLNRYLDVPPAGLDLLDADGLVPLGEFATVTYGYKTGANAFFFFEDAGAAPVDERFLSPAVTSFKAVAGLTTDGTAPPAYVLDVHEYVEGVAADRGGDDLAAAVLDAMAADGYGATVDYVRAGADEYADRATCAGRRVWFDLGSLEPPAALHPKFFDDRVAVVHNRGGLLPSNAIDCLRFDGADPEPLLGALNCSLYALALECWGRPEGGGALQLMTYELARTPVPDVRAFDPDARRRVDEAFRAPAAERRRGADEDGRPAAARELDAAVLGGLGLAVDPGRVADLRDEVARRRTERARAGVQLE
jgi:SAM-dependent methyltransferase